MIDAFVLGVLSAFFWVRSRARRRRGVYLAFIVAAKLRRKHAGVDEFFLCPDGRAGDVQFLRVEAFDWFSVPVGVRVVTRTDGAFVRVIRIEDGHG